VNTPTCKAINGNSKVLEEHLLSMKSKTEVG
jgi:hypothetical protein